MQAVYNLIVTYNRAHMLSLVLLRLSDQGYKNIIIVDNASSDNTSDVIEENCGAFDECVVITHETNLGGAGGFASAMRRFVEIAPDNAVAMIHDDDSWPSFSVLEFQDAIRTTPTSGLLGCFPVLHPDGTLNNMNIPGRADFLNSPFRFLKMIVRGEIRRPKVVEDFPRFRSFDYSSFVGLVISKAIIKKFGIVSDQFFIYSDDTTYTCLVGRQVGGVKLLGEGALHFTHDCKRGSAKTLLNGNFAELNIRNKVIFLRLCSSYPKFYVACYFLSLCLLAPSKLGLIVRGILKGLTADHNAYGLVNV